MVLPIYAYGQPILRQRAAEIEADSPELQALIDDMIETSPATRDGKSMASCWAIIPPMENPTMANFSTPRRSTARKTSSRMSNKV